MFFLSILIAIVISNSASAQAEVIEADNNALSVYGSACEEFKAGEPNTSIRVKATDKACYSAITSLPEIIGIKDSFDDHDFNVIVYNIIDEYIEDLDTKTTQQDNEKICIEISGYITPENIGKAIDEAIQMPRNDDIQSPAVETVQQTPASQKNLLGPNTALFSVDNSDIIVISTVYIQPTEFYNNTQSRSHSRMLENILSQSDSIKIVNNENDANFIITPKILKAKIEPLNKETNRLQMVLAIEIFDKNKNNLTTEHQNKFILFNSTDNEQVIAKDLLRQLFEQSSISLLALTQKSSQKAFQSLSNSVD